MAGVELPYRAEYAKSGRAGCKGCKEKIEKEHLRLAVMVQSPMFDGKVPHWYHFSCFFHKQRVKDVGDISHFESLRWEDQEKIRKQLQGSAGASTSSKTNGTSSKATKRKSTKSDSAGEFKVEYAKSNRSECRGCEEKIVKGDVRACIMDYESDEGRRYGGLPLWHHLDCFAKLRNDLKFWSSGAKLSGFKSLGKEDQIKVEELLPEIQPIKEELGEEPPKKIKVENNDIVKTQNQKMFKYRDYLKTLSKNNLIELLTKNKQEIPKGPDKMLDRLADAMTFGALKKCPTCKDGQLTFRSGVGYFCLGEDEWAKCESVFDDPARVPFVVPKTLKEEYEFLKKYKCKLEKRVFEKNAPSASTIAKSNLTLAKSMKSEPGKSGPKIERPLPLKRMEFFIGGKLKKDTDFKQRVLKLGAAVGTKVHPMTTAVLCNEEEAKKNGSYIKTAKEHNIQVVSESFLEECEKGADAIAAINRMNLATWGSDPSARLSTAVEPVAKSKSGSRFKSTTSTVKLKIQGGVAVEPQSGLESIAHVYRDPRGNIYNASLSLTDLQSGKNSYYKLQVLESNGSPKSYWFFRAWGRIGTTIGDFRVEDGSREDAIEKFTAGFLERTANSWHDRKNFVKKPGKMVMVDVSYDDDEVDGKIIDLPSKLEKPVQELIKLIFNIDLMKNVMKEMELDLEKMPLGKLSKKQIQEAFTVLTRLQDCVTEQGEKVDQKTVISCTNQFFSLIPHDFGIDNPPLLNDLDMIRQKTEMLDSLMEIEIAYSLLKKSDEGEVAVNRIDSHYRKLKAKLRPLGKTEQEFETLKLYVQNTHAETHKNYELEITEVFKVERQNEDARYAPFKNLHNRKLLWHGSRLTNFVGILSQGLRIAPPEAPVTGYMFGKGIYFADMVSKSANYCMASPNNKTGLLLLCEVALGDMHELFHAENITKLPKGKHSVKGIGKTHPDPAMAKVLDDGVEIPLGCGVPSEHSNTSLLYNEYIVYNVAQVKVRYLVQVNFNFPNY